MMAKLFGDVKSLREAQDAINSMRNQIQYFKTIKPTTSPTTGEKRYNIGGQTYTQAGFDKEIKMREQRITELYNQWIKAQGQPEFAQEKAANQKAVDELFQKLSPRKIELETQIKALENADRKAATATEQDNIRTWLTYYKSALVDLNSAINKLRGGAMPAVVPPEVKFATVAESKKTSAPIPFATSNLGPQPGGGRGQAVNVVGQPMGERPGEGVMPPVTPVVPTEPTVPSAPVAAAPVGMVSTGLTAGQRGEAGIAQGLSQMFAGEETPDVQVDETPETAPPSEVPNTPSVTPQPTTPAPSYTDPGTGVTYQPGQQVGGEDRALPNGGAVVDGVYIPPGIDYAWLGQQVPEDWEDAAKELYGGYYEMLKQVPELGRLLKEAFEKGWEPGSTSFQYALEQTDWWKTTTASARAWQEKLIRDPETARSDLDTRMALLRGVAQDMGITLSPESLEKLATDSIILNFQLTSQYEDVIGSEARKSFGGVSQLRYGYVGNSIRESARKYGISLSDTTFNEWVDKIAVGAESQQTFESYAQQIARNLYPALNNGFDRGLSFAQMTDPYAQVASRILEIPGAQVDFTDPKWAAAFTMKDTKGEQMQMSFGEWADYLRTDPRFGWEYTDDAKNRAYTVANRLAELFGAA